MCKTNSILKPILIIGFHNADLITEADLTKTPSKGGVIFKKGDFLFKKGAKLRINRGNTSYVFNVDFSGSRCPDLTDDGYYQFKGGQKYDLTEPAVCMPRSKDIRFSSPDVVDLPERNKVWGGGGLNTVLAIRALSPPEITKITYFDIANKRTAEDLYDKVILSAKSYKNDDQSSRWKLARNIAEVGPEECLEVFLSSLSIDYNFCTTKEELPRTNLVITKMTNGVSTVGDRVILVSKARNPNQSEDEFLRTDLEKTLREKIINAGTVVLNTVTHWELFQAVVKSYVECCPNSGLKDRKKLVVAFTQKNVEWFAKMYNDGKLKQCAEEFLRHANCVFSETEFCEYLKNVKKMSEITKGSICLPDGSPNFKELPRLLTSFRRDFRASFPNRHCITFGSHGSVGVDELNTLVFVKTYPTRGIRIYDTTACGDAWCGAFSLLEHHKDYLVRMSPATGCVVNLSRFMRFSSGAALAKMTNPTGALKRDEFIALLDSDYIPWARIAEVVEDPPFVYGGRIDNDTGQSKRIKHAASIDYREYNKILFGQ